VPHAIAYQIGQAPPVASLFAAFLGYNPVHQLLAPTGVLAHLSPTQVGVLTGKRFFPQLISGPFHHGLVIVFSMAMALLVIAAFASLLRGGRYVHEEAAVALTVGGQTTVSVDHPAASDGQRAATGDGQRAAPGDGQRAAPGDGPPAVNGDQPSSPAERGAALRPSRGRATPDA
jgi:hypothetical protein